MAVRVQVKGAKKKRKLGIKLPVLGITSLMEGQDQERAGVR